MRSRNARQQRSGSGLVEALEPRQLFDGYLSQSIAEAFGIKTTIHEQIAPPGGEFVGFGWSAVGLGDLDGDGFGDFAVSAPGLQPDGSTTSAAGAVFFFSGKTASLIRTVSDGAAGFGVSMSSVGDWNGDGKQDLAVGSARFDGNADASVDRFGRVTVYSGADGSVLREFNGSGANDEFGFVVNGSTDFDNDGKRELVVGAPGAGPNDEGQVIAFSGADGSVVWTLTGDDAGSRFGHSFAIADFNLGLAPDGVQDIVVGSPGRGGGVGAVSLFDGVNLALKWRVDGTTSQVDGASRLGWAVASDPANWTRVRAGYFWSGHATGSGGVRLHTVTGVLDKPIGSWEASTNFGPEFVDVGDMDFDGRVDTASLATSGENEGVVINGSRQGENGKPEYYWLTGSARVFGIGDIDGDGVLDLFFGRAASAGSVKTSYSVLMPTILVASSRDRSFAVSDGNPVAIIDHGRLRFKLDDPTLDGEIRSVNSSGVFVISSAQTLFISHDGVRRALTDVVTSVVGAPTPDVARLEFLKLTDSGWMAFREAGDGWTRVWRLKDGVLSFVWVGEFIDLSEGGAVVGRMGLGQVVTTSDGVSTVVGVPAGFARADVSAINSAGDVGLTAFKTIDGREFASLFVLRAGEFVELVAGLRTVDHEWLTHPDTFAYRLVAFDVGRTAVVRVEHAYWVDHLGYQTGVELNVVAGSVLAPLRSRVFGASAGNSLWTPDEPFVQSPDGMLLGGYGLLKPIPDADVLTPAEGTLTATATSGDGAISATVFINKFGEAILKSTSAVRDDWLRVSYVGDASAFHDVVVFWEEKSGFKAYYVTDGGLSDLHGEIVEEDSPQTVGRGAVLYDQVSKLHSYFQSDAEGDLILTFRTADGEWRRVNLVEDHFRPFGREYEPVASSLVTLSTPWGGLSVAYLDATGDVRTAWWAPGLVLWLPDNLSLNAGGAPKLHGNLVSNSTSWGGLGVTGTDLDGDLLTLWWAPGQFTWQNTKLVDGTPPRLDPLSLAAWTTDWGGMNIIGLDLESGKLTAYWWAPGRDGWTAEEVVIDGAPTNLVLRRQLSGTSGANGSQLIAAANDAGHLVNLVFGPGTGFEWRFVDVTGSELV